MMKKGFTFIEMIFVIVIMGILAKFGAEIFRNVYQNYTNSTANNELQINTELTMQQIANRLQYRIKDSVIATLPAGAGFVSLSSVVAGANYQAFEWIGYDIDGWLGNNTGGLTYNKPTWTGFIDVDALDTGNADFQNLFSPGTDSARVTTVVNGVSPSAIGIGNCAIFFSGENSDVQTDFGWWNGGLALGTQSTVAAHRIQAVAGNLEQFNDATGADFNSTDIYEQYKLSWTAYALGINANNQLILFYDYRPWEGDQYTDANVSQAILMENVDTAKLQMLGDMINIQVCVNENNITGDQYAICKEKTIF